MTTFCLRSETKLKEKRRILSPESVGILSKKYKVLVEECPQCIYPVEEYREAGAEIIPRFSWVDTDPETIILGLKELPEGESPLVHTHVFFAHCYKGQDGSRELLNRFSKGNGKLLDLEYLVDENSRRIAAFGYWAGYLGAALAALYYDSNPKLPDFFGNKDELLGFLRKYALPKNSIVLGSRGRSGKGAVELFKSIDVQTTEWDLEETKKGGPFSEILTHDVFVNCVFSNSRIKPFLTLDLLDLHDKKLNVISDVSCDPGGDYNTLPIYDAITTMDSPWVGVRNTKLIAIDHLPSLLPRESSDDFSAQLLPYLIGFDPNSGVWKRSLEIFNEHLKGL